MIDKNNNILLTISFYILFIRSSVKSQPPSFYSALVTCLCKDLIFEIQFVSYLLSLLFLMERSFFIIFTVKFTILSLPSYRILRVDKKSRFQVQNKWKATCFVRLFQYFDNNHNKWNQIHKSVSNYWYSCTLSFIRYICQGYCKGKN